MVVSLVTGDVGWPIYLILGGLVFGLGAMLGCVGVGLFPVLWLLELLVLLICGLFDSGDGCVLWGFGLFGLGCGFLACCASCGCCSIVSWAWI